MSKIFDVHSTIRKIQDDIEKGAEGLVFDPVPHTYIYKGKSLESVSAICSIFEAPFDGEYWAKKKADATGVSINEILESWNNISRKACDDGTYIHAYGEWNFYRTAGIDIVDPEIMAIDEAVKNGTLKSDIRINAIDDVWKWLTSENSKFKLYPVAAENRIVNPELGYAGTFDLLFLCVMPDNKYGLIIFDYKTNKNLFDIYRHKGGNPIMMKPPFHNIPNCNAAHYSCQLSLYQLGLERVTDIPVIGRVLFWVNPLGAALIDSNDKLVYKEAHKRLEKAGEKSKWSYLSSYTEDIEILKRTYKFKKIGRFGMLKLPYFGTYLQDALLNR